ncbi:hypothetical protein [Thalassotalea sp. PLHSN55]|uniref:hypothetical protein n=1 Tax=Thalassotalea sp. PLHSN55 TaxID=3435888 RepID=UPI003F86D260
MSTTSFKNIAISKAVLSEGGKTVGITLALTADKVVQINFIVLKDINSRKVSVDKVYYTLN